MTVEKIKKIYLMASTVHREVLLEKIQDFGMVQIVDLDVVMENNVKVNFLCDDGKSVPERRIKESLFNEVLNAIKFLEQYLPPRSGFALMTQGPDTVSREREKRILDEFDFQEFIRELKDFESQVKKLHVKKMSLENRREYLDPWRHLDVPLNYFCRTEHTRIRALSVPTSSVDACRKAAEEAIGELFTMKVGETRGAKNIVVIYHKDAEDAAEKVMRVFDVHPAIFPCVPHTPDEILRETEKELDDIQKQNLELESKLGEMNEQLQNLRVIANHLDNYLERKRAKELGGETSCAFFMEGWVPESKMKGLEETVHSISQEIDLTITDPKDDDNVPIILQNPGLIRPFEFVLEIYGKPNYHEYDPTPSMAFFFFICFGYCLADVGYGMILALLFGWASWKWKMTPGMRKFFQLLSLSGLSSIIVGIVTGSWFGNLLTAKEFPTYKLGLAPLVLHLQKLDPLGKNMLLFLGIALAIGFIQLCWGLAIKLFFHLSNRSYKDAMFDSFPPLLFVSGLVVLFFNRKTGMIISGISLIVILFFAGRQYKNPIVRIGMGVWTIYGTVTGFLSDVLSYSRLFALGLASGIMASVTNILAFIISSIIPIPLVNWIICIIFLVIAHTLNLAINVLGAFIHTTRLQFVEFFQKFYINGGRRFEPLSVKERFITFSDNHDK